ncbi:MAG: hypothetical protein KIT25_06405 [Enhydrobacter sp.]|nr:MAG: hypothetical protein KIT25_06405 [Enhydrobacter sp.]
MTQTLDPQLEELIKYFDSAERLQLVATRIGLALWQLQDLEASSAMCFAMVAKATKGMGIATGYALLKEARSKTFGPTIEQLAKHGILSPELVRRFDALREERNWLVHRSQDDSRGAVHNDQAMRKLVLRLESMKKEALALHQALQEIAMRHATKHGISREEIMARANKTLAEWRSGQVG